MVNILMLLDLVEVISEVVERFSEQADPKAFQLKFIAPVRVVGEWDRMRLIRW